MASLQRRLAGRYAIQQELGRGGMGAVYLARDLKLDRLVALKVLPEEFAVQPQLRDRFLRETRTAAGFSHPNIVPVYSVEESDDLLAYAMGYVEGESLADRVRRGGALTVRETVKLMQDVAYALAYAHGRGIVHRDIKPDNIMIDRASGRGLVMDFGISRTIDNTPAVSAGLTRVGEVVGTPEYMSPEQASGDDLDGRSDLYALGLTMMFGATGRVPVTGESTQKVLVKQLTEILPPVNTMRADLPPALAAAIDRCVLKNPEDRFARAEELVEALDSAQLVQAEVPLPMRMFQQEASTLTFLTVAFGLATFYIARSAARANREEELLIVVILFAIVFTRAMQTFAEAQRLALSGFSKSDFMAALTRVASENETRRAELRADPDVVRTRRKSIVFALGLLVLAVGGIYTALQVRVEISPGRYMLGGFGSTLVIASMFSIGMGLVLLLKSPLRMPLGERVFRKIWLGPLGRGFVSAAVRAAERRTGWKTRLSAPTLVPVVNTRPQAHTPVNVPTSEDRIARIERRLDALERDRR
jgi:hypothetical protein